jgi:tetratricopeptide (TPR) repeat protein
MLRPCATLLLFAWIAGTTNFLFAQSSESALRYSEQGQKALAEGRFAEAEQAFEQLARLEPGIAEVHANLGLIYFQERKFDLAVPALRRALKLKPSLSKTDALLAMSLSEIGHFKEALPGLERGMRTSNDPEIKRMCGLQLERVYTGLQRDSDAVKVALELNRLYPDDPEVLYHNGKIVGNFAFLTMQKLGQVAPNSVWRHQAAAEAYESQGSYTSAIGEYREVLELEPRRPGVHYRLGRALLSRSHQMNSTEDAAEAEKEFQQELDLDPANANAAYEVGEARRKAGQFEDAQHLFERAVSAHPEFEEAQVGLAAALIALHKPADALLHAQKAVELRAEDEAAWYRLVQVHRALGNTAEQQAALAKFNQLHQKAKHREDAPSSSADEVTKQEVDSTSAP